MRNIEKFYDNTKDAKPNNNVKKFIELKTETGNAIELGCGAGRDTIYLIKNDMTFLSKEDVLRLFNDFEIISFKEIEKDMKTGLGKMKHWHIFDVIAKKK